MAKVGDVLPQPEAGWKRYDETNENILYEGNWIDAPNVSNYMGSRKYSVANGDSYSFYFKGDKIRIIAVSNTSYSKNIEVFIDGISYGFFAGNIKPTTTFTVVIFEAFLTQKKEYHVKVVNREPQQINLDAIDINEDGFFGKSSINKTFILSTDGYKKLDEGSPETESRFTPTSMTQNTTPEGISVSASSTLSGSFEPFYAFANSRGWASLDSKPFPHWITIDLGENKQKAVASYRITGISSSLTNNKNSPLDWSLQGSNNGSSWTDVDSRIDTASWSSLEERVYVVDSNRLFRFYRLYIRKTEANTFATLGKLELFERIPPSPPSWKTVSPTLPTLTQFQSEGMDDLSILDRKLQQVIESPQQMTSEVLGEGKVFKGTVDLQKLFDLRKLEVK
ncbi:discoidin domain-containing protein [Sporosarcina sp. FSL W7-1283]|uniref:discoidin domain-containing protein n=1 Tax=Sporosarcina sp. FSL W7-1283 TaxID=2921560 RepID=UPI0030F7B0C2